MDLILMLLIRALDVFVWVLIAQILVSWLVAFDVVNMRNPWAAKAVRLLYRVTEPLYRRVRQYVPPLGGMDLSPMVIIFTIYLLQNILARML